MSEISSAGKKEFFLALLGAGILYLIGEYIKYILPSYKVIGDIIEIIMFAVFAYFVLTRYAAVYTYTLADKKLRINRKTGKRNKEFEIKASDMKGFALGVGNNVKVYTMKKTILRHREDTYLLFNYKGRECAVLFTPSKNMRNEISKLIKKGK